MLYLTRTKKQLKISEYEEKLCLSHLLDWAAFLRIDDNKTELFRFLSEITVFKVNSNKNVLCVYDMTAICNNDYDHSEVSPCSHEEADTRVFAHTKDSSSIHKRIAIRTVI